MTEENNNDDVEIRAITLVHQALRDLGRDAQKRVIGYFAKKFAFSVDASSPNPPADDIPSLPAADREPEPSLAPGMPGPGNDEGLDGVSPVAVKWAKRNGLEPDKLSAVFSLGLDEIDLVAEAIPGSNKKEKMRNVLLLKGIAS
jgi:hypothetical protein